MVFAKTYRSCCWIPACAHYCPAHDGRVSDRRRSTRDASIPDRTARSGGSERSATIHDSPSLASVEGDGAEWPPVEQEVSCLFQPLRTTRLVGSAGSTGHFSWFLLLIPGIPGSSPGQALPSALRAGCAVRHRSRRWRGRAKRRDSGAGRRPKARRRRATSRPNQNQKPWPNERAAPDPPLIPTFSPKGRRSQERKPVAPR
jgi:hypothetical protein